MSLGRKLFLLVGGFVCLLLVGQWLLFRSLTRARSPTTSEPWRSGSARTSSRASRFRTELPAKRRERAGEADPAEAGQTHLFVVTTGEPELATGVRDGDRAPTSERTTPTTIAGAARCVLRKRAALEERLDGCRVDGGAAWPRWARSAAPPGPICAAACSTADGARRALRARPGDRAAIPIPDAEVASTLDRFGSRAPARQPRAARRGPARGRRARPPLTRPLAEPALRRPSASAAASSALSGSGERRSPHDEVGARDRRVQPHVGAPRRARPRESPAGRGRAALGARRGRARPRALAAQSVERPRPARSSGWGRATIRSASELVEGSRRQIRRIDGALRSFLALASAGAAQARAGRPRAAGARSGARGAAGRRRAGRIDVEVEPRPSAAALASQAVRGRAQGGAAGAGGQRLRGERRPAAGSSMRLRRAGTTGRPAVRVEVEDDGAGLARRGARAPLRAARHHQGARLRHGALPRAPAGDGALRRRPPARTARPAGGTRRCSSSATAGEFPR